MWLWSDISRNQSARVEQETMLCRRIWCPRWNRDERTTQQSHQVVIPKTSRPGCRTWAVPWCVDAWRYFHRNTIRMWWFLRNQCKALLPLLLILWTRPWMWLVRPSATIELVTVYTCSPSQHLHFWVGPCPCYHTHGPSLASLFAVAVEVPSAKSRMLVDH
jgi:hypothetical protein